jgi:hypothetical protein
VDGSDKVPEFVGFEIQLSDYRIQVACYEQRGKARVFHRRTAAQQIAIPKDAVISSFGFDRDRMQDGNRCAWSHKHSPDFRQAPEVNF